MQDRNPGGPPLPRPVQPASTRDTTKEDRAYTELRLAIRIGRLGPGSRVGISAAARDLGISDIPVRAALQRLCGEGLVTFKPNSGYRVAVPDPVLVSEAERVLGALWELAGRLAAVHGTESQFQALERLVDEMRAVAGAGDAATFGDLGAVFHEAIAEASGNSYLVRLTQQVTADAEPGIAHLADQRRLDAVLRDHEIILEAITRRNAERAAQVMWWHMEDAVAAVPRLFAATTGGAAAEQGDARRPDG
jgi:DNA-binding GntR family transcriptional regulator